jgi:hypothetical protein
MDAEKIHQNVWVRKLSLSVCRVKITAFSSSQGFRKDLEHGSIMETGKKVKK